MARMLARAHALGPGGVNCRCCGTLAVGARTREKQGWRAEWSDYQTAEDVAWEFNQDHAIGILFGDVDPK